MTDITAEKIEELKAKIDAAIRYMEKQKGFVEALKASSPNIVHNPDFQKFERYVLSVQKTYTDDYNKLKDALANDESSVETCVNSIAYELNQFASTKESCENQRQKIMKLGSQMPKLSSPVPSPEYYLVFLGVLLALGSIVSATVSFIKAHTSITTSAAYLLYFAFFLMATAGVSMMCFFFIKILKTIKK